MKLNKWSLTVLVLAATPVFAVSTAFWQDSQSTDFKAGKTENLVITNTGKVSLGLQVTKLLESRTDVTTVFDVRLLPGGEILAGGGPEGLLLVYKNKKWETLYKSDQPYIFSLEVAPNGTIYLGTGGNAGKVIEISPASKEGKVLFENKDVQYIWSMKRLSDGKILAATGPKGKLFLIDKTGAKEIFSCKQKNIQSLVVGPDGSIYVGTDTEGLVYKIQFQNGKYTSRAIYDAAEEEISALALDTQGILYAATASSNTASDQAKCYLTKLPGTLTSTTSCPTSGPAKKADPQRRRPSKPGMSIPTMPSTSSGPMSMPFSGPAKGNAVYRIDTLGFVSEVFRDQVNINSMILEKGKIYLGTGPDGFIFAVDPATEEVSLFAKTAAGYVNALQLASSGEIVLGTGNPGQVIELGPTLAKTGTLTSKVFDAGQISRWGNIDLTIDPASSGTVSVQTRSSVIANAEDPGWSEWSKAAAYEKPLSITSPLARYFQYKLTFEAKADASPAVKKVQIAYMQDNRRPHVVSVTVNTGQPDKQGEAQDGEGPSEGPPAAMMPQMPRPKIYRFSWRATDPNGDALRYILSLRRVDTPYWINLEKDMTVPLLQWDPKNVPDGKYELKVLASDKLANPIGMGLSEARISDPFLVDNTPPVVRGLKCKLIESGKLLVQAELADETSEIASAYISINAAKNWQYIAPADEIYDSKTELIDTVVPVKVSTCPIMLTIKVTDRAGNIGYGWVLIPQPKVLPPHPSKALDGMEGKIKE
jgi:outer membrane protein assembly factor BamB